MAMGGTCGWAGGTALHVALLLLLLAAVVSIAAGVRGAGVKSGTSKAKPNFVYDPPPTILRLCLGV